jgi:hypothetical protein
MAAIRSASCSGRPSAIIFMVREGFSSQIMVINKTR